MDKLKQTIIDANNAYHNGQPIMTDDQYDALIAKYESLTGTKWSDVGAPVLASNGTVRTLPIWMGSMNKVKEERDITAWQHRHSPDSVLITDKLDGISCLFAWYPSSKRYEVFTRGNGKEGTDITGLTDIIPSLLALKTIVKSGSGPKWIYKNNLVYFIRGELVIPKEIWERERTTTWSRFANTRNTVSGLVNQKLATATAESREAMVKLHFVPFSIDMYHQTKKEWMLMRKEKMFAFLTSLSQSNTDIPNVFHGTSPITSLTKQRLSVLLEKRRNESPYDIDGIIVWDNTNSYEPNSSGNPSHAFAFKMVMDDQKAETLVVDVEWNVSRQGVWKPVVCFEQVSIGGTTISRATGHNASWLVDRKIGVGSRILLVRSGDVIPKIHQVLSEVDPEACLPFPPDGTWRWDKRHTDLIYASESSSITALHVDKVVTQAAFLVSTIKSKGLSSKMLEKYILTHKDVVKAIPFQHLFPLIATKDDWLKVESVKDKRATMFVEHTKNGWLGASVVVRLVASGVLPRGIGIKQIESIVGQGDIGKEIIDNLIGVKTDINNVELQGFLCGIPGMGDVRAGDIVGVRDRISRCERWLQSVGLSFVSESDTSNQDESDTKREAILNNSSFQNLLRKIGDKTYYLMTGVRNAEWSEVLDSMGKQAISGLANKHTADNTVVITGPKRSGKVVKAEEKGIIVINYNDL